MRCAVSCLAVATVLLHASATSSEALRGRAYHTCKGFDRPAALAMDPGGWRPIAFARDVAVVYFPTYWKRETMCHAVRGVVSVAANSDGSFWIAHGNVVDRVVPLNDGGSWIPSTIRPCAAGDRVEAVAVNRAGQMEVAVTTGGDATKSRLLLFDKLAHDAARPLRTFSSRILSSAVDDVTFDRRGTIFVYDDAGEILAFAANANGADVQPLRAIAGRRTQLRPASPGAAGTRHLVVDAAGDIVATDAGIAITFGPAASGDAVPTDVLGTEAPSYGIGITRTGGLFAVSGSGYVDSFAPMVLRVDKSHAGIPIQMMEIQFK